MAEPFLAEIRIMSFIFAPKGWALCNGQFLPINQNQALFSLLGTTYGGDGRTTFALPNLRGRTPMHAGNGHVLGEASGKTSHTLITNELPTHTHALQGTSDDATVATPAGYALARSRNQLYHGTADLTALHPATMANVGGSQPHENLQPYETLSFCIALQGIFPSPN